MRIPACAVGCSDAAVLWLMASAALSLMLAWLITGPAILPSSIANVCQQCLAAATPFPSTGTIDTVIPAALLVFLPTVALIALAALGVVRGLRRRRTNETIAYGVVGHAERTTLHGYQVLLTRDPHPTAYSLPRGRGGIVISDTLASALRPDELAAVLAHEREHVRGRHHFVLATLDVMLVPLRWLPLMSAISKAVPHYLEISADNAARRHAGTPALASALLKLGEPETVPTVAVDRPGIGVLLHAAGPDRIGHMVAPPQIGSAIAPISALSTLATALAVVTATVHGPYISVIIAGCYLSL